jgi:hypothetical protein
VSRAFQISLVTAITVTLSLERSSLALGVEDLFGLGHDQSRARQAAIPGSCLSPLSLGTGGISKSPTLNILLPAGPLPASITFDSWKTARMVWTANGPLSNSARALRPFYKTEGPRVKQGLAFSLPLGRRRACSI